MAEFLSFYVLSGSYNLPGWLLGSSLCFLEGDAIAQVCTFYLAHTLRPLCLLEVLIMHCTQRSKQGTSLRVERSLGLLLSVLRLPVDLAERPLSVALTEVHGWTSC